MLFWGLITIPNWFGDCVLTNAQYELLTIDQPLILYNHKEGTEKHSAKEMEELAIRWQEKRKGQKVNFNDFLRKGIDTINKE